MIKSNFTTSPYWQNIWIDLCGPDGFQVWNRKYHDLGLCFQYLFFDIPFLVLLAIASAYYFGTNLNHVIRGKTQLYAINIRCLIVSILTFLPLLKIYIALNKNDVQIEKIFYFVSAMEGFTWLTHLMYTLALRSRLGLSSRGPVTVCVLWTLILVMSIISMRTHIIIYNNTEKPTYSIYYSYAFSICNVMVHLVYGLTMLPSVGESTLLQFENTYSQVNSNCHFDIFSFLINIC